MSVVTVARYRAITGDEATPTVTVSAKLELAEELLADELCRELDEAQRTETLWPTRDGYVWPSCTPITDGGSYIVDGHGLIGVFGPAWPNETGSVAVTYTGGWVERSANPTASNRLPAYIEADIAFAAHALATSTASDFPRGATSVTLGDAAVSFGADGAPGNGVDNVRWSRKTLRHRATTTRGVGTPTC